jgi:hypothetical protein
LTAGYFVFRRKCQPASNNPIKTQTDKSRSEDILCIYNCAILISQITELPSSRCRASSAVGGDGEEATE